MKNTIRFAAAAAALLAANVALASPFTCVEVEEFSVDRANKSSNEMERAAEIPAQVVGELQTFIVANVPDELDIKAARAGKEGCPDASTALVFGGQVTDYKKGNQAMRYMVGFGAGKQKFQVEAWVKRKTDGEVLHKGRIVDRKVAGILGGSKDKGKQDFAEKVAKFIAASYTSRS